MWFAVCGSTGRGAERRGRGTAVRGELHSLRRGSEFLGAGAWVSSGGALAGAGGAVEDGEHTAAVGEAAGADKRGSGGRALRGRPGQPAAAERVLGMRQRVRTSAVAVVRCANN
ncbi:hypothetical protein GCM10027360_64270 [Amycolatopsis echigonensis]